MSDNRSSSGNISGFIRARERTHRHHNVQRSNLQPSTFQRSSLYLVSSAHEREHTVITTFNVPTFNVQHSNVHHYIWFQARTRENTPSSQRSTFQPSTFNVQPPSAQRSTFNVQRSTAQRPKPNVQRSTFQRSSISGFKRARERTHRHHNVQRSNLQPSTFNLQTFNRPAPNVQPSTFKPSNLQPSTFNLQPSTLQPSTFNLQPSTFNLQPSTFNLQPSNLQPSSPHTRSHTSRLIQRHTWRVSPPCAHHSSTA
jgi:hypothetical protein